MRRKSKRGVWTESERRLLDPPESPAPIRTCCGCGCCNRILPEMPATEDSERGQAEAAAPEA